MTCNTKPRFLHWLFPRRCNRLCFLLVFAHGIVFHPTQKGSRMGSWTILSFPIWSTYSCSLLTSPTPFDSKNLVHAFWCLLNDCFHLNVRPQTHGYSVWLCKWSKWSFRLAICLNVLPHTQHMYGFSGLQVDLCKETIATWSAWVRYAQAISFSKN